METKQKHEQMLFTAVTVEGEGSGSGVVISSEEDFTLILTAKHVVEGTDEVDITFYPDGEEHVGSIIKMSKKRDLALIAVEGYTHPYVAEIAGNELPAVYTPIWKVGGGLSIAPHPGEGIITGLPKNIIQHDAGTIFGDSGGGLFVQDEDEQFRLLGIIIAVAMAGKSPMTHIGLAQDIGCITRFLSTT